MQLNSIRKVGRKRKNIPVEEVKQLYKAGLNLREIAQIYGVSRTTILSRMKEEKTPRRKLTYIYK